MPQQGYVRWLQGSSYAAPANANGNGALGEVSGVTGAIMAEVVESLGGTATLNIEGSFDATFANAYLVGYQPVNGQVTLTRAAAALAVTANSKAVYQILDAYPFIRARISGIASAAIAVRLYYVAN